MEQVAVAVVAAVSVFVDVVVVATAFDTSSVACVVVEGVASCGSPLLVDFALQPDVAAPQAFVAVESVVAVSKLPELFVEALPSPFVSCWLSSQLRASSTNKTMK